MSGNHSDIFEAHRSSLTGLAYRMTGSMTEAEDMLQDAWIRWQKTDIARVSNHRAFLHQIITRLCLDRAKSASVRRETYVGPWLPEPVHNAEMLSHGAMPDKQLELADDLSFALLITLETLSPLERAAFLLHDVFDYSFEDISLSLTRTPEACRKLASRARQHIKSNRPGSPSNEAVFKKLVSGFMHAVQTGDTASFADKLSEDAILYSDGGGKKAAALNPIYGREHILKFVAGVVTKFGAPRSTEIVNFNGEFGLKLIDEDDTVSVISMGFNELNQICEIYIVRNPDKLNWMN